MKTICTWKPGVPPIAGREGQEGIDRLTDSGTKGLTDSETVREGVGKQKEEELGYLHSGPLEAF